MNDQMTLEIFNFYVGIGLVIGALIGALKTQAKFKKSECLDPGVKGITTRSESRLHLTRNNYFVRRNKYKFGANKNYSRNK